MTSEQIHKGFQPKSPQYETLGEKRTAELEDELHDIFDELKFVGLKLDGVKDEDALSSLERLKADGYRKKKREVKIELGKKKDEMKKVCLETYQGMLEEEEEAAMSEGGERGAAELYLRRLREVVLEKQVVGKRIRRTGVVSASS